MKKQASNLVENDPRQLANGLIRTKRDMMNYIEAAAGRFRFDGIGKIVRRNKHTHKFEGKFDKGLADAVLVSFINYIGGEQGLDEGFYLHHLLEEQEKWGEEKEG